MKIYFVRHGKTEWNLEKRLQGQTGDSPLLEQSYLEIEKVAKALENEEFDSVIASPAKRAQTTAKLLRKGEPQADDRLAEWNFGELEGYKIVDAIAKYPDEMYNSRNQLEKFDGSAFGAEPVEAVLARFDELATSLSDRYEKVLLVGHGASGTAGVRHLAGFPVEELRSNGGLDNNTVSILESKTDGGFELLQWNKSYE